MSVGALFNYYNCDHLILQISLSQMSLWDKIVEKKGLVIAAATAAVAIGAALLYKSYQDQDRQPAPQQDDIGLDLKKQIEGLRSQIDVNNPSLDDIKLVLEFSMGFAKKKIYAFSKNFKKRRQSYNGIKRKQNMTQYMNVISNGMQQIQNLATQTQTQILQELGLSEASFRKYQAQLGMFMQELMMNQGKNDTHSRELSLQQVKYAIRLQIQYLRKEGEEVVDGLLQATKNWPPNKKQELPYLFAVVVADGAFEDHPEVDQEAVQNAEMKLQHHLMNEMTELQQVMGPLMRKVTLQTGGMGGMGGFGGMEDKGAMGFGQQGMGHMGGLTMQELQQLQQLEQLRLQDPAAFQQMMRNMYG